MINSTKNVLLILLITSLTLFYSCSSDNDSDEMMVEESALVSSEIGFTGSSALAQDIIAAFGLDVDLDELEYDMELYKVVYNTTYQGEQIDASGVVVLPKTEDPVGMLSFQHGTILSDSEAPSTQSSSSSSTLFNASLASPGLIVVIPDYIGYAASGDYVHPYLIEEAYADAIIDNIKAAVELAEEKGINFDGELYLAGYSEGGYATMVAHKAIEEEPIEGITLQASFPGSGIYQFSTTAEQNENTETLNNPEFFSFRMYAYYDYYDLGLELTDFWNEPYASRMPGIYDGSQNSEQAREQLTNSVQELLAADFINNVETDSKYSTYLQSELENNILNFVPTARMYLSHGNADLVVPYESTVDAYNYFIDNGASEQTVTFETHEGGDHATSVGPYIEGVFNVLVER